LQALVRGAVGIVAGVFDLFDFPSVEFGFDVAFEHLC
jgi:hypothetical protein